MSGGATSTPCPPSRGGGLPPGVAGSYLLGVWPWLWLDTLFASGQWSLDLFGAHPVEDPQCRRLLLLLLFLLLLSPPPLASETPPQCPSTWPRAPGRLCAGAGQEIWQEKLSVQHPTPAVPAPGHLRAWELSLPWHQPLGPSGRLRKAWAGASLEIGCSVKPSQPTPLSPPRRGAVTAVGPAFRRTHPEGGP